MSTVVKSRESPRKKGGVDGSPREQESPAPSSSPAASSLSYHHSQATGTTSEPVQASVPTLLHIASQPAVERQQTPSPRHRATNSDGPSNLSHNTEQSLPRTVIQSLSPRVSPSGQSLGADRVSSQNARPISSFSVGPAVTTTQEGDPTISPPHVDPKTSTDGAEFNKTCPPPVVSALPFSRLVYDPKQLNHPSSKIINECLETILKCVQDSENEDIVIARFGQIVKIIHDIQFKLPGKYSGKNGEILDRGFFDKSKPNLILQLRDMGIPRELSEEFLEIVLRCSWHENPYETRFLRYTKVEKTSWMVLVATPSIEALLSQFGSGSQQISKANQSLTSYAQAGFHQFPKSTLEKVKDQTLYFLKQGADVSPIVRYFINRVMSNYDYDFPLLRSWYDDGYSLNMKEVFLFFKTVMGAKKFSELLNSPQTFNDFHGLHSKLPVIRALELSSWSLAHWFIQELGAQIFHIGDVDPENPPTLESFISLWLNSDNSSPDYIHIRGIPLFYLLLQREYDHFTQNNLDLEPLKNLLNQQFQVFRKHNKRSGRYRRLSVTIFTEIVLLRYRYRGDFSELLSKAIDLAQACGADINTKLGENKETLLLQTVKQTPINKKLVEDLLELGADLSIRNQIGETPHSIAAQSGNLDLITIFNNHSKDIEGGSPLWHILQQHLYEKNALNEQLKKAQEEIANLKAQQLEQPHKEIEDLKAQLEQAHKEKEELQAQLEQAHKEKEELQAQLEQALRK